jgi:hypothetical protein
MHRSQLTVAVEEALHVHCPSFYLLNKHSVLLRRQSNKICLNQHNVLTNLVGRPTTVKSGTDSFLKLISQFWISIKDADTHIFHKRGELLCSFSFFIRFVQLCQVRNLLGISIFYY